MPKERGREVTASKALLFGPLLALRTIHYVKGTPLRSGVVMPKMKTNRLAYKKFLVNGKGNVKRSQSCTSHNTGKKSAKRMRRLRRPVVVDKTNRHPLRRMLPYLVS